MKVAGYMLFAVALLFYVAIVRSIRRLISEVRQLNTGVRFNRFWWPLALKAHRNAYPASNVRKRIVVGFPLTIALLLASVECLHNAAQRLPK
jgi:hypothetical protein